jgi:GDP-4-dehydro-6-deoxy-D-mannose reductase
MAVRERCLITGARGFVGGHLATALIRDGYEVVGLNRSGKWDGIHQDLASQVPLHHADLIDRSATEKVLAQVRPDWIFHLAGFANPGHSFRDPPAAWQGNLGATQALYEVILSLGMQPRILFVSSGLVYGDTGPGTSICSEETVLRPASPYAASKAAADLLSYQQTRNPGLDIVRVRPFNQIGPGQSADYAAANFARQIAGAESGKHPRLVETGDLGAHRDLTDVRDMVRAYIRLLQVGVKGEVYNAGSGTTICIRDLLHQLVALAKVPVEIREKLDPSRAGDTAVSRADVTQLKETTGWQPAYTLEQTLSEMLADWRQRV